MAGGRYFFMEITNENFLYVKYNEELDRLQLTKKKTVMEKILSHKIISLMITILIVFSCLNFFLIYSFIKVLENI